MTMLTLVKIDGIDVAAHLLPYETENAFGDSIGQCKFDVVTTVNDDVDMRTGLTVEVWRGWTTETDEKIFSGYIESFAPDGGKISIVAKNKIWDLIRKEVTKVYDSTLDPSAGVISEIFEDLVTTYGELNADATTIQDSGTVQVLSKFVCNHADIFERCRALAAALEWQFFYRADTDMVYFEPLGYSENATTLTVGDNIIQVPKWEYDNTEMVNDLTVVGAYQEIETTESGRIGVTAGYTESGILISLEPLSVKVFADASNPPTTLKTGGVISSTASFYYSVDKNKKMILPAPGTSFTANDYFEIRYSAKVPVPIHVYNQTSIDLYGKFKKTLTFQDIRTVADAEIRGRKHLAKYSTPFTYTTVKVKSESTNDFRVGQLIPVIDNISSPAVSGTYVINRHKIRWPGDYEELIIGDKEWRLAEWTGKVEERLKRLEEEQFANQDIVVELPDIDNTLDSPIVARPRYLRLDTRTVTSGSLFVLGHSSYGILGTGVLGDAGLAAAEMIRMIPGNMEYIERFMDEDFKGSGNLNWNTALRRLSLV